MGSQSSDKRICDALEVFARGYCFQRSRTHPYLAHRVEGLWRMYDAERKNAKDYRREEWVAFNLEPKEVDRIARATSRGRFCVCAIRAMDQPLEPLRDAYKAIGYRLGGTEPLFVHDLKRIAKVSSPARIERVCDRALAERFAKAWRMKPMPEEWLQPDSPIRQYVALANNQVIGAVSSIDIGGRHWVSGLYVRDKHRRQGVGSALMTTILRDDRKAQSRASILMASHVGAKLYVTLGYQMIGELLLLTPRRR